MNRAKLRSGGRLKSTLINLFVLTVVLFNSLIGGVFISPAPAKAANGYSDELDFGPPPYSVAAINKEYGIWVDRSTIVIYLTSSTATADIDDTDLEAKNFTTTTKKGINDGKIE